MNKSSYRSRLVPDAVLFLLCISGLCIGFKSFAQDKPKGGTITGHVTIEGKPAPTVPVVLISCPENRISPNAGPAINGLTDNNGDYRLTNVPDGRYCIDGFTPQSLPLYLLSPMSKILSIAAGETVEGINFEYRKGGVLTGRITDSEQRPVIEGEVTVYRQDQNGRSSSIKHVPTDDRGVYRAYGLLPGKYSISVGSAKTTGSRVESSSDAFKIAYYPGVPNINQAKWVDVTAGDETTDIDLELNQLINAFTATGTIVDVNSGLPVTNAIINCFSYTPQGERTQVAASSTPTNSKGEFAVENLAPGRYMLDLRPMQEMGFFVSPPALIEIKDADLNGLAMNAYRSASVSGSVAIDGYSDPMVKSLLSKLTVVLGASEAIPGAGTISSKISPEGGFRLTGLRGGKVTLGVTPGVEASGFYQLRVEKDGAEVTTPIYIEPGEALSGFRIVVAYANGILHGGLRFDGAAPPLSMPFFVNLERTTPPTLQYRVQVDARYQFTVKNLVAGRYDVSAVVGYAEVQVTRPVVLGRVQGIEVSNNSEQSVTIGVLLSPPQNTGKP